MDHPAPRIPSHFPRRHRDLHPRVAPLAGGIITTYFTWHWIFLINVPLGTVAFIAALRLIPAEARKTPPPLDWIGLALTGTGLGSLVYLGSLLAERDPGVLAMIGWAVVGVGLVGFAIVHQLRTRHPLLDLRALRIETFRLSHAGGSLFRLTVNAVPFLVPLLFQDVFGYTPLLSGALVLFVFVGNLAIKPATTSLLRRFGFRAVIVIASAAAAVSMALMALLSSATPVWLVIALLTVSGVARSAGFTAYNTIAFADVERAEMTDANTLASTLQQVAAGFGVAVGAVALRVGMVSLPGRAPSGSPSACSQCSRPSRPWRPCCCRGPRGRASVRRGPSMPQCHPDPPRLAEGWKPQTGAKLARLPSNGRG